ERVQARQNGDAKTGHQGISTQSQIEVRHDAVRLRDLRELRFHVAHARELEKTVGAVNPRPGGLLNRLIQVVKKIMQRALSWYTRPLKEFHAEVIGTTTESTAAISELQQSVMELRSSLNAQSEARKLMEAGLNWQINGLSKQLSDFSRRADHLEE